MIGPRKDGQYQPGFYKIRLVRGGVWVPAEIRYEAPTDPDTGEALDRSHIHIPYINGQVKDGDDAVKWLDRINVYGQVITENDHDRMVATVDWAKKSAPDLPEANQNRRADLGKMRPLF